LKHSLLLSTYYFFPICHTIPNDVKFFKHITNLFRKLNSKKYHPFWQFFIEKWACEMQLPSFSQIWKNGFGEFECLYLTIYTAEFSETFTAYFQFITLQDPTLTCVKIYFFSKNLVVVLEMAVLERFWWIHSYGTLGVKPFIS